MARNSDTTITDSLLRAGASIEHINMRSVRPQFKVIQMLTPTLNPNYKTHPPNRDYKSNTARYPNSDSRKWSRQVPSGGVVDPKLIYANRQMHTWIHYWNLDSCKLVIKICL